MTYPLLYQFYIAYGNSPLLSHTLSGHWWQQECGSFEVNHFITFWKKYIFFIIENILTSLSGLGMKIIILACFSLLKKDNIP